MSVSRGVRSKADLDAESAFSFPLSPIWLGIQHVRISSQFGFYGIRGHSMSNNQPNQQFNDINLCRLFNAKFVLYK